MYLLENSDRRIVMNFCFVSSSDGFCDLCAVAGGPDEESGALTTGAMIAFTAAGTGVNSELGRVTHVGGGGGGCTIIALTIGGGGIGVGVVGRAAVCVGFAVLFSFALFGAGPPPFEFSPPQ